MEKIFEKETEQLSKWPSARLSGRVVEVIGLLIESDGPDVFVGEVCYVYDVKKNTLPCQVVGFKKGRVVLMSYGETAYIAAGAEVYPTKEALKIAVSESMCGRVLDALGRPIDKKGKIFYEKYYPAMSLPPPALSRMPIEKAFVTKIKAIDGLITLGQGQRMGIFSGPGVGKSSLMAKIAKCSDFDVCVIALIGERGREVREFIDRDLGREGLHRSVVFVASSDQSSVLRSAGANAAMAAAEFFRDLGKHVLLMMDSVSRYAMALREIGLALSEPPTTKGYTPSVFAALPRLLERAGNSDKGSITAIFTILQEGEGDSDPISEQMRSLLDGHITLCKDLAQMGVYPPIDILKSLSRVRLRITSKKHQSLQARFCELLHVYFGAEELIRLGVYTKGSDPKVDEAQSKIGQLLGFLSQRETEVSDFNETMKKLEKCL